MVKVKFKKGSKRVSRKQKKPRQIIKKVKRNNIGGIDKSTKMLLALFLVILIGFSIVLIAKYSFSSDSANEYNGFVIKKGADNLWHLSAKKGSAELDVPLHFHPEDLEGIKVYGDPNSFFRLMDKYELNGAYITFNPAQGSESFSYTALAASELSLSLKQAFAVTPISACAAKTEGVCESKPIVDCSSDDRMVIFLEDTPVNKTEVSEDVNCISVKGQGWELVKAAEKLLYIWYGVI